MRLHRFAPIALAGLLLAAPLAASAGEGCNGGFDPVAHVFDASDTDGSGTLSRQEYEDAGLARYGVAFDDYDADGDGETTYDEYLDLYESHHPAPGEIES